MMIWCLYFKVEYSSVIRKISLYVCLTNKYDIFHKGNSVVAEWEQMKISSEHWQVVFYLQMGNYT